MIEKNPADTKFVPPSTLPEEMAGRALTPEEARRAVANRKALAAKITSQGRSFLRPQI
jgi:hypothetical protein